MKQPCALRPSVAPVILRPPASSRFLARPQLLMCICSPRPRDIVSLPFTFSSSGLHEEAPWSRWLALDEGSSQAPNAWMCDSHSSQRSWEQEPNVSAKGTAEAG